jgi:hypothetical protein
MIDLRGQFENTFDLIRVSSEFISNETDKSDLQNEKHHEPRIRTCRGIRGCPTSGVAQRAVREAAPHARGVSKARQL